jgi:pyrroline-5-carboxylate reductase
MQAVHGQSSPELEVVLVGAGNMGQALLAGLLRAGWSAPRLGIVEPDVGRCAALQAQYPGLQVAHDPASAADRLVARAQVVVLAVKPQILEGVARPLAPVVTATQPLVISVAAGVTTARLAAWLGTSARIIRAMPNTPALIGAGITGLFAGSGVSPEDCSRAERILRSVGQVIWLDDEEKMHAVTAVSGSGPAYLFYFMEAMQSAGVSLGLDAQTAQRLTLATIEGAARLAASGDLDPAQRRAQVTSPGGTTEQAIRILQERSFSTILCEAMEAAARRSRELGQ